MELVRAGSWELGAEAKAEAGRENERQRPRTLESMGTGKERRNMVKLQTAPELIRYEVTEQ